MLHADAHIKFIYVDDYVENVCAIDIIQCD